MRQAGAAALPEPPKNRRDRAHQRARSACVMSAVQCRGSAGKKRGTVSGIAIRAVKRFAVHRLSHEFARWPFLQLGLMFGFAHPTMDTFKQPDEIPGAGKHSF